MSADIGLVGLAVMGENIAINIESRGFTVAVYEWSEGKADDFVQGRGKDKNFIASHSLQELCEQLARPRKVLMMVKAGTVVEQYIEKLVPFLEEGDIVIDGGNSHFADSQRRTESLAKQGILFVGAGVSGGEEGALNGPSIMPGGSLAAWPSVKPILQAICARSADGSPCCEWVGPGGSGHYVKMVHNGIEYGDMQIICESYHLMRDTLGLSNAEMGEVFRGWNQGDLESYLVEITANILSFRSDEGEEIVDKILDRGGQKGTGKWTAVEAFELGVPLSLIGEAVFARCLSALKHDRVLASRVLPSPPESEFAGDRASFLEDLRQALFAAKLVSYSQGFMLLQSAAAERSWDLHYGQIALMWRGGCIIRSSFLGDIKKAFDSKPDLKCLLLDPFFFRKIAQFQAGWRRVVAAAAIRGVPVPCISAALSFYDGYRCENLPANLLQAQRDYFGAHMYERIDRPEDEWEHTNWTGRGGTTASSAYKS